MSLTISCLADSQLSTSRLQRQGLWSCSQPIRQHRLRHKDVDMPPLRKQELFPSAVF